MFRQNSRLRPLLGPFGVDFVERAAKSIQSILPHTRISSWAEIPWQPSSVRWSSPQLTEIKATIAIGDPSHPHAKSLQALVSRRGVPITTPRASRRLNSDEHAICSKIIDRIDQIASKITPATSAENLSALADAFEDNVIANYVREHHHLDLNINDMISTLRMLSEQSYENKALTFGCVLDPTDNTHPVTNATFPRDFVKSKKYKALSDGFRTAYHVSRYGKVLNFFDLDGPEHLRLTGGRYYFPEWAEPIASLSINGKCGIALSRQGDILIFDGGTLKLTYRYGQWQYWNHTHLVKLLRDRARAQNVSLAITGKVVGSIYKAALDVSFRRSGGLFVILKNRNNLNHIVRRGDAIGDDRMFVTDAEFDTIVGGRSIQLLSRPVTTELASLDGAVVVENSGRILAYGAVLDPRRPGRLEGTEGSRTKAAIGASNYGVAIKISSDGDISVYHDGREFIRV